MLYQKGGEDDQRYGPGMADPPPFTDGQVVTVFRSRLSGLADDEFHELADVILELAQAMPGYVDYKTFAAEDGERATLVTFADDESQRGWRTQVDHAAAQRAGRDRFYSDYNLQVCTCTRVSQFARA